MCVDAAMQKPTCTMKPSTMVFPSTGCTASGAHSSSGVARLAWSARVVSEPTKQSQPAMTTQHSQAHHSLHTCEHDGRWGQFELRDGIVARRGIAMTAYA
jgi:hypothetical protein